MDTRKVVCNYICMLYIVLYGKIYYFFGTNRTRSFETKWTFFIFAGVVVLAVALVYLVRQKIFALDVSNFFLFLILCNLHVMGVIKIYFSSYTMVTLAVLFANMLWASIDRYKEKKRTR